MLNRILGWLGGLPAWGTALLVVLGAGAVVGGGVAGYRTFTWVEHDNEFCLSCHLMEDPFDRFARSEHRGLGCKACHKPTFAARSQMALTQVVQNPDSLAAHAEVPDEKCASCHIEGDPARWENIRSSAGHRIHLESEDPALEGLQCVECHSSGVHEFAAVDRTCAQSGCHTESRIQLGAMSDLTIHCAACHGFNTPVQPGEPAEALAAAVTPDEEACLSCHAMRALVAMPPGEPHGQACGLCHNPHEQATPEQAAGSCSSSGCHTDAAAVTPMHRGLDSGVLESCTTCHQAHDWALDAGNCLACHQDVFQGPSGGQAGVAAPLPEAGTASGAGTPPGAATSGAGSATGAGLVHGVGGSSPAAGLVHNVGGLPGGVAYDDVQSPPDTVFRHDDHRDVACLSCHSTEGAHGRVEVTALQDCRSCHHTARAAADCAACHEAGPPPGTYELARSLDFTVGEPLERSLPFDHGAHEGVECAECHTEGLALSASAVDCAACHEAHHAPEGVRCASCHVPAPVEAHPPARVHAGCAGAGCHTDVPVEGIPRTRDFCLTCHQELEDHRPGRTCSECHQVPAGGTALVTGATIPGGAP